MTHGWAGLGPGIALTSTLHVLQVDSESLLRPPVMHKRQKSDEAAALAMHLPDPPIDLLLDVQDGRHRGNMLLQCLLLGLFANRGLIRVDPPHSPSRRIRLTLSCYLRPVGPRSSS